MIVKFLFEMQNIFKGILIGISISAPLGPIGVLCIQRTINKGLKSGVISGAGAAMADTFYAIIAGFGLTFISDFLFNQQDYFRVIGGIFLIYFGLKLFKTKPKTYNPHFNSDNSLINDFLSIFFLTVSNPMTIVAFGAIFAALGFVHETNNLLSPTLTVLGVFIGAFLWWGALMTLVNNFRDKLQAKKLKLINTITGICVIILGIIVFLSLFL